MQVVDILDIQASHDHSQPQAPQPLDPVALWRGALDQGQTY